MMARLTDRLKASEDEVEHVKAIPADECSNTLLILEYYSQPLVPSVGEWVSNSAVIKEHATRYQSYTNFPGNKFASVSADAPW